MTSPHSLRSPTPECGARKSNPEKLSPGLWTELHATEFQGPAREYHAYMAGRHSAEIGTLGQVVRPHRACVDPALSLAGKGNAVACALPYSRLWRQETSASKCLSLTTSATMANVDIDAYLGSSVFDLLSLKDRTVVITGGARGLGLAFALAVVEVGGDVAVLDAAAQPHEHFFQIKKKYPSRLEFYQ
ncbi:hypothetical protein ANO11243_010110 [Dothideomycetidae sp. 11243]|nr:hypothetical protein ANO11243_010110 [fungal sp. No.11243]